MSYIYGAPSKARNANVVYIWTYVLGAPYIYDISSLRVKRMIQSVSIFRSND